MLTSDRVSQQGKSTIAAAVRLSVEGQVAAAERLAELIASEDMPEQSKFGLSRAYEALASEQENTAETLEELSDQMPAQIRAFVEQIVQQARDNAQGLREDRPTPPAGHAGSPGADHVPPGIPGPPSGIPFP